MIKLTVNLVFALLLTGCSLHWYDRKTGTEHLWGFGHLKMRAAPQRADQLPFTNAVVAFVTGVQTVGLNLGAGSDFTGVGAGWDSRARVIIRGEDTQFYLLWPSNSVHLPQNLKNLFTVRVGPDCPFTNGVFKDPPPPITNHP